MTKKILRIEPSATPGIYKFWFDGMDISEYVMRAEMVLRPEQIPQVDIIVPALKETPDGIQMITPTRGTNGSVHTGRSK